MKNLETTQTIDCTPSWEALLPLLLDLYSQAGRNNKATKSDLLPEFKNMAIAADMWNAHVKALKAA